MKALDGISDNNDIAYAIAEGCRVYTEHYRQTGDQASGEIAYSLLVSDNAVMGATYPMSRETFLLKEAAPSLLPGSRAWGEPLRRRRYVHQGRWG